MERNILHFLVTSVLMIPGIATGMAATPGSNDNASTAVGADAAYQPLFTEGKEWVVAHGKVLHDMDNTSLETHQILRVSVDGDEVVDGRACKRLKVVNDQMERYGAYNICGFCHDIAQPIQYFNAYEDDRKIYVMRPVPWYDSEGALHYDRRFDLYMDLNVTAGDEAGDFGTVSGEEVREYGGLYCRTLTGVRESGAEIYPHTLWIEGIGSNVLSNELEWHRDPEMEFPTYQGASCLVRCSVNGVPVYDENENLRKRGIETGISDAGIEMAEAAETEDGTLYNLQGLMVTYPRPGEIYIRAGKKIRF